MMRFTLESAVLLAIAVTVFRAFFAEGYMISTGSMAPSLLGYHRQCRCPACEYRFARGAATEADITDGTATASAENRLLDIWTPVSTRCPNCGSAVAESAAPRTEGDQLMVHKHHYDWCDPERWEVVVFRNPKLPTQAYVKRVVGLPGESIELLDGDVYADGVLQRKPLAVQRALRVPVDDSAHQPAADAADWRPRWQAASTETNWKSDGRQFRFAGIDSASTPSNSAVDWVAYRHWVLAGGRHTSRVPLAEWPSNVAEPNLIHHGFRFDAAAQALEAVGALPQAGLADWQKRATTAEARAALAALYERSHQPPLSDVCAYNHPDAATTTYPVHDLMLELSLTAKERRGEVLFALHDGTHELICTFDLAAGTARVTADGKPTIHREGALPGHLLAGEPALITVSQFDRQLIVAIDEQPLFEPLLYAAEGVRRPLPDLPVRFGARESAVAISGVRLDRDVYYTANEETVATACALGPDEFYVLGDNSPVSLDSRAWEHPAISRDMLIGRPFVVHLPSRPQTFRWGNRELVLRVPDFSRVRYIR
jgi:signal peptidase I